MIETEAEIKKIVRDKWFYNAEKFPDREAIIHWVAGEEPYRWTFSSLISQAEKYAIRLKEKGIKKGDVCAIIIKHNKNFYPVYLAVSLINAIPAVLAYPNPRLHPDKFKQGIIGMSQRSGLDWILTERSLENIIKPVIENPLGTIKGLHFPLEWNKKQKTDLYFAELLISEDPVKEKDPFLLQHSSGTTGLQKPVLLSHKAVIDHINNYAKAINLTKNDKVVSWLPLYHDMGLIAAFHLPLLTGIPVVQIDTFEWIMAPSLLLEAVAKEKGTISWLPNFAYNVLAEKIQEDELEGIDLSSWRLLINCSEPVRSESHDKFLKRYENYGFKKNSLSVSYAMAETTFAVTQTIPGKQPTKISVDRNKLSDGKVKVVKDVNSARVCISSGNTINGCEIKIVDEYRNKLPENKVGEIAVKSVSMFEGYRNYPEKTKEVLKKGWYYSGDIGFIHNEECFVIGRNKDIIIVAGNNIYPEDVEDVVSTVEGVIPGRVVAFGEFDEQIGSEQVSVIAETKLRDEKTQKSLKMKIIKTGMGMDITIKKVYLVPPRWLIKSSAGKPSRKANRKRIVKQNGA